MVSFSCTGQHSVMRNVTFASLETPLAPGEPLAAYLEHVYHEPPREPLQLRYIAAVVLVGDGGGRLFASIARGHIRARRIWSARLTVATAGAVDVSPNYNTCKYQHVQIFTRAKKLSKNTVLILTLH